MRKSGGGELFALLGIAWLVSSRPLALHRFTVMLLIFLLFLGIQIMIAYVDDDGKICPLQEYEDADVSHLTRLYS